MGLISRVSSRTYRFVKTISDRHRATKKMCGGMMTMAFHTSCANETVLFDFWVVNEGDNLALSCFIIVLLGMIYHFYQFLQEKFKRFYIGRIIKDMNQQRVNQQPPQNAADDEAPLVNDPSDSKTGGDVYLPNPIAGGWGYIIETILQFIYYFYVYSLMLIFMTYQLHMCLSLCLGLALGYYLFTGWLKPIGKLTMSNGPAAGMIQQTNAAAFRQEWHCCD